VEAAGASWREVDWSAHIRRVAVTGGEVELVDLPGPAGVPLVLVHGLGGHWAHWLANLLPLARHRRVVAVDLPGCGRSEPPAFSPPSVDGYARAVGEALDALGIERAVLVGHSFGGSVVARLAARRSELADRVVLVAATGMPVARPLRAAGVAAAGALAWFAARLGPSYPGLMSRRRLRRLLLAVAVADPEALDADLAYCGLILGPTGSLGDVARAAVAFAGEAFREAVTAISCDVLVIWGAHDRLVPVAHAQALADLLARPQLVVIPDAGHLVMLERPSTVERAMSAFLNGCSPNADGACRVGRDGAQ